MSHRKLPIRWRLTVWYASLLAIAMALFGAAIYIGLRHELFDNLNEQLNSETSLILGTVQIVDGEPQLTWRDTKDPYEEEFARLISPSGLLIVDSAGIAASSGSDQELFKLISTGNTVSDSLDRIGIHYLTRTEPVTNGDTIVGALQVGHTTKDVTDVLRSLRQLFLIVSPLVIIIAGYGGYVLSGRALRPVRTITALAREIDEQDLDSRLNLNLPDDELGQLATTFDAMLDRIELAFNRQRRFVADAAHELRTPISLMRSRVDVALTRDRPPEQYKAELRLLQSDLERLSNLAAELLSVARSDSGQIHPHLASFDIALTIAAVVDQYLTAAQSQTPGIVARTEPTIVGADEDLMIQVLANLLDNAIIQTPATGSIEVGCSRIRSGCLIWVEDTGPGIPPELRERVFDRFFRIDTGRTRAIGGAGLGLTICRALVEAQNGTIRAVQPQRSGARIEITLPAAVGDSP